MYTQGLDAAGREPAPPDAASDAERERGVGEDAGDEDALAVEEGHEPETATVRPLLPA